MNLILTSFVICGAVLSVITLHSCWIHRKTVLTWIYPVVAMLAIMFAAHGVEEIQGFPLNAKPNVEFEYLTHYEEGESVLVLLKISGETKTYRFVPTKEEKEKLQDGEEAKAKGQRPLITFEGDLPKMRLVKLEEEHPK